MDLSKEKEHLIREAVKELMAMEQVKAVVLGGSYAMGKATATSDIDLGIYYAEHNPLDVHQIKAIAAKFDLSGEYTVTDLYQWGPWVNGGAWLSTAAGKIDFLYRNIDQVERTIANARAGVWENHFEQQPPYGFSSTIYLAETRYCIPLYDPEGVIARLKDSVQIYPPQLKKTIIQDALWSAEFTMLQAQSFAEKADIYNTAGCLTRALKSIVSALAAINEIYLIGDKRAIAILEEQEKVPANFGATVAEILSIQPKDLHSNLTLLKALFGSVCVLADGRYTSLYNFKG